MLAAQVVGTVTVRSVTVCLQHRLWEQLLLDLLLCALSIIGQILQQLNCTQDSCWMAVDETL